MKQNASVIIPTLLYKDTQTAIEWLCKTFGFEKHLEIPGENGIISHAQLIFGNAMIMIGAERDNEYGKMLKSPQDLSGFNTQAPYIIVTDIYDHYQRAIAAGAEIVLEIKEEDYGGHGYSCKDPEGHLWSFGSYNPWE